MQKGLNRLNMTVICRLLDSQTEVTAAVLR